MNRRLSVSSLYFALRALRAEPSPTPETPEELLGNAVHGARAALVAAWVTRLAMEVLPFARPFLVGLIVDALSGRPSPVSGQVLLWGLLGLAALRGLVTLSYGLASARVGLATVGAARTAMTQAWLCRGLGGISIGDALTRAGRDADRLRGFTDRVFVRGFTGWVRGLVPGTVLLVSNPGLALLALGVLPVHALVLRRLEKGLGAAAHDASCAHAALYESLEVFFRKPRSETAHRFATQRSEDLEAAELRSAQLETSIRSWALFCTGAGVTAVWAVGFGEVSSGDMSLGELVSFTGYVSLAYRPLRQLAAVSKSYRSGAASLERVAEVLKNASRP